MTLHPISIPETEESLAVQPELEGKNFGPRFFAYLIDGVCLWLVSLAVGYSFRYVMGFVVVFLANLLGKSYYYDTQLEMAVWDTLIDVAVAISYFALFESLYGASPGKVLLRMRVVTTQGENVSVRQALVRGVFRLFDGLFFAIPAITRMREPLYQRYGDAQADTMVIDRSSLADENHRPLSYFLAALFLYWLIVNLQHLFDLLLRSSFL
ncbi:MAG: RDD family protein [Chloroflexi bacterium]|nr:RDD family protein [Chloroflexota bacterium]